MHGFAAALRETGSSMFTLGFASTAGTAPTVVDVLAAATGLVVVALQIAYLPTLYSAFNRRETEVTLLTARAGTPPWGPELLVRTRYGVAVRSDDLPAFYNRWERWAADVAESHSNYPVLIRFRSPQALSSWLVGLLAVMDSAAMLLALCPSRDRIEPRRAIRMGFTALRQIGIGLGMAADPDPDPDAEIQLRFEDFAAAVEHAAPRRLPHGARRGRGVAAFPGLAGQLRGPGLRLWPGTPTPSPPPGPGPGAGRPRPSPCAARPTGRPRTPSRRSSCHQEPGLPGKGPVARDGAPVSRCRRPGRPGPGLRGPGGG